MMVQVLKKADMIRKNAVESILAERNILISIRNPFVVCNVKHFKIAVMNNICKKLWGFPLMLLLSCAGPVFLFFHMP